MCGTALLFFVLTSGKPKSETTAAVFAHYQLCLDSLDKVVGRFQTEAETATPERLKDLFATARHHYKKIEWLVEYHYPSTALKLNGPSLPEAEASEPEETLSPSGFQVLEELVYDEEANNRRKEILFELSTVANRIAYLRSSQNDLELTESTILDALKLNLYRLIAKGITGFDSPVAKNSVDETLPTLEGTKTTLSFFNEPAPLLSHLNKAIAFVKNSAKNFDDFNRAVFITQFINPICKALTAYQRQHNIPFATDERAVATSAETLFDDGAFDPMFFAPQGLVAATPQQIVLGKRLFGEPLLSSTGSRSCASCHQPGKAFTDGLAVNQNLSGSGSLLRNTPTLLNAALQPVQFYDSRIAFLEDQVHDVISSEREMGGLFDVVVKNLRSKKTYRQGFATAFADKKISAENIRGALAAYVRSLVSFNSAFDRYMRGDEKAMTKEQVAGFNLFAGKAACATCHFLPTFSGTVPPLYDKMESEVLGVPATRDTVDARPDSDSGKYHLYKIPHQLFSFKTPSLRNAALTAPYMHNGVYNTLEDVIDFYDRGGGAGLGFDLSNQTLPPDRLNLTAKEKAQLLSFLRTLNDETGLTTQKQLR